MKWVTKLALGLAIIGVSLTSCDKKASCYDEALYQQYKDSMCPMDCPGVIGCDGKTYCNACIARSQGISVD